MMNNESEINSENYLRKVGHVVSHPTSCNGDDHGNGAVIGSGEGKKR